MPRKSARAKYTGTAETRAKYPQRPSSLSTTSADTQVSLEEARRQHLCESCRRRPRRRFVPNAPAALKEREQRKTIYCDCCIKEYVL